MDLRMVRYNRLALRVAQRFIKSELESLTSEELQLIDENLSTLSEKDPVLVDDKYFFTSKFIKENEKIFESLIKSLKLDPKLISDPEELSKEINKFISKKEAEKIKNIKKQPEHIKKFKKFEKDVEKVEKHYVPVKDQKNIFIIGKKGNYLVYSKNRVGWSLGPDILNEPIEKYMSLLDKILSIGERSLGEDKKVKLTENLDKQRSSLHDSISKTISEITKESFPRSKKLFANIIETVYHEGWLEESLKKNIEHFEDMAKNLGIKQSLIEEDPNDFIQKVRDKIIKEKGSIVPIVSWYKGERANPKKIHEYLLEKGIPNIIKQDMQFHGGWLIDELDKEVSEHTIEVFSSVSKDKLLDELFKGGFIVDKKGWHHGYMYVDPKSKKEYEKLNK